MLELREATRFDVTSIGEVMLRLSVPNGDPLEDTGRFDIHAGGAESNVCAALSGLGHNCGWVSRLPDNPLGRLLVRRLQAAGIDTASVLFEEGARVGVYYVEFASPPRSTQVVYDRAGSAAATMGAEDIDWDYLLNTRILHLTGITPSLGEPGRFLTREAIRRAKAAGVAVSFDINYRSRLWSSEAAADCLRDLISDVDLLICGRRDASLLFDLDDEPYAVLEGLQALTNAQNLVLTLGEAGAVALEGDRFVNQKAVPAHVIDRFGAGDAFAAGVLDGLLGDSFEDGLLRGTTLAALALAQRGDMLVTNRAELEAVLMNPSGDRILR